MVLRYKDGNTFQLGGRRRNLSDGSSGGIGASGTAPEVTYETLMQSLAWIMWRRYNETSGTTTVNHGSAGAALNGVWTPGAGALGQTGHLGLSEAYNFDGADSVDVVPNTAAHNALAASTRYWLFKPDSAGEGALGSFYIWGFLGTNGGLVFNGSLDSISGQKDLATTNAVSTTTNGFAAGAWAMLFETYDHAGDKKIRYYKYPIGGPLAELTYSVQTAGVGNVVAVAGTEAYYVGNRFSSDLGFDGLIDEHAVRSGVLTTAQMTQIGETAETWYA